MFVALPAPSLSLLLAPCFLIIPHISHCRSPPSSSCLRHPTKMKFFGNNKVTRFLEDYHPYASVITLLAIEGSKYYNPDTFNGFTDLSYETSMKRGDTEHVHYKKGWDDAMFVFFYFNVVTVIRFLYRKLVLEVWCRLIIDVT